MLAHKVAIVTGGGTGIGKAVAASLARNGARVAIASRNPGHIEAAKADFEKLGLPVLGLPMDLRKKNEIQQTVAEVAAKFGLLPRVGPCQRHHRPGDQHLRRPDHGVTRQMAS